ncbi:beta-lactamase family protein [Sphingomonas sp. BN140010]|uniref:Beta-lactamase family protein n=1 Tax=Sphingomonas arvum TaxID=2992113 RepID=A0ABT3JEY7_9SPHN|nr:serine hydrolase domain-containing protein [Sphingomonas sp. BN140010]MCW3797596.1 beta-lactamase family protein [Sphingomonas sp. BN140010]
MSNNPASPFGVPGAIFAIATPAGDQLSACLGEDALGVPLSEGSLAHLASASKLATGLLILRLIEDGLIDETAHIGDYLADARVARTPGVTIERMLCHIAGLPIEVRHELSEPPGDLRVHEGMQWPGELAEACLVTDVVHEPGTVVQYSNVAYGLLALAAERVTRRSFADLLQEIVFEPLRIEAYVGRPAAGHVVAVTDVPSPYTGTPLEPYNSPMSREGGTPWAGVLTDVSGLLTLVRSYSASGNFLSPAMVERATTDRTGGLSGGFISTEAFLAHGSSRSITWSPCPWGLAVELQGGKQPHWAPPTMPGSFGQIGSSGCVGWHDPATGVTWALIASRTTESGWLVRHGARIAQSALAAAGQLAEDESAAPEQQSAIGRPA